MKLRSWLSFGLPMLAMVLAAASVSADDAAGRKQDEQAIRATAKAYQAALTKGDSKALADFWTADGDFIDDDGDIHPASELAEAAAKAATAGPQPEAKTTSSKIRFLARDVAIEEGTSEVALADTNGASTVRGHFHAIWVKQDGRWRLANLCEIAGKPLIVPRLVDLDWMVGNWSADSEGTKLEVNVQWNATRTFLLRDTKAIRDGNVVFRGSQRFGWDPLSRKLKSWSFDSDGGYGEATWAKDGDSWVGQATGVLPDGRQTSATTIITLDGKDSYWRKIIGGRLQGEPAPDQLVRFTRRAEMK